MSILNPTKLSLQPWPSLFQSKLVKARFLQSISSEECKVKLSYTLKNFKTLPAIKKDYLRVIKNTARLIGDAEI